MRIIRPVVVAAAMVGMVFVWDRVFGDAWRSTAILAPASPVREEQAAGLRVERRAVGDRSYTIFSEQHSRIRLTLTRPSREDARILLAVPGTYTSPHDSVEGMVVLNGRIVQARERQGWDGAVIFDRGRVEMIATENGRSLTYAFLKETASHGRSLIQVHLLVHGGVAQSFKPQPLLPRRALAVFTDGVSAVIEGGNVTDLTTFATDLVHLGVRDAVNLDMGSWSEGWYRNPTTGATVTIGIPNPATARQTNWVVLEQ